MSLREISSQNTRGCVSVPRAIGRLCALGLLSTCLGAGSFALKARQPPARQSASPVTTLTPLAQEIEKQRARLASDSVEERRDAVARLGRLGRPEGSRAASSALGDRSPIVRATAARAVLALPPDEAVALLVPLLHDHAEFVRREGAYALGETHSPTAVPALLDTLEHDKSAGARGAAVVALEQIKDLRAVPALMQVLSRQAAGANPFRRIKRSKATGNEFVRREAARALGQIGDHRAVPALVAVLSDERTDTDVRREAAQALGTIGDRAAIPALRAALTAQDPYLSRIAYEALRKIDPAEAAKPT